MKLPFNNLFFSYIVALNILVSITSILLLFFTGFREYIIPLIITLLLSLGLIVYSNKFLNMNNISLYERNVRRKYYAHTAFVFISTLALFYIILFYTFNVYNYEFPIEKNVDGNWWTSIIFAVISSTLFISALYSSQKLNKKLNY